MDDILQEILNGLTEMDSIPVRHPDHGGSIVQAPGTIFRRKIMFRYSFIRIDCKIAQGVQTFRMMQDSL